MVESYIDTLTGAVDPEEQVDRYRVALEQLVEAKVAGLAVRQPPRPAEVRGDGVDLMEALRRSVEEARRNRATPDGRAAPARKAASTRKAEAKKTVPKAADNQAPPAKTSASPNAPAQKPAVKVAAKPAAAHARAAQSPARKATATKAARKPGPRNAQADND